MERKRRLALARRLWMSSNAVLRIMNHLSRASQNPIGP